tara:strand:- start:147 stop:746 length:600 start_codon:yes stop_codon:yes gene_type:complete
MRIFIGFVLLMLSVSSQAGVYKHVDKQGRVSYTDTPPHDGYVRLNKSWKGWTLSRPDSGGGYGNYKRNKKRYSVYVDAAATRYNVDKPLVHAIIHAESYYNPVAVSSAGAVGLMQLMPATAKRFGVNDRQNPEQNINGGVRYFSELMALFKGDLSLSLAAYNAGENAVKRYGRIPPYPETQNYVRKVLKLYSRFSGESN